MGKIIQSKYKLDRRMGENIWGRPKSPVNLREYGPGHHGQRRKSKISDYGIQLMAKQKLKGYYGKITEKQFRSTYDKAGRMKGETGENLVGLMESRLDAVVYRAKFAPTVFGARQIVSHGHVLVNGKKCNIPSRKLSAGDVVELREKSRGIPMVIEAHDSAERDIADYIERDGFKCKYLRVPTLDEIPYPVKMEPNLVIEFYSR
ncbi:MAG: 30S ribosomal protein S4 [Sphingomonadales bacterium]